MATRQQHAAAGWALTAGATALLAWLCAAHDSGGQAAGVVERSPPLQRRAPAAATAFVTAPAASATTPAGRLAPGSAAARAVPIDLRLARELFVGETTELVIALGPNPGVGSVALTVRVDPDVLQLRAATEGDWAADATADARFSAELSDGGDELRLRSVLLHGRRVASAGGSVAVLQLQAMAPGRGSVLISDVALSDADGRPATAALSAAVLQINVESGPALRR